MTTGYKATYNYKCRDQIYEIGKEYKINEKPVLCKKGFHYCLNPKHTLNYYKIGKDFKLLQILDLNPDETEKEENISCSNHIEIIREIVNKEEQLLLIGQSWNYDQETRVLRIENINTDWFEYIFNEQDNITEYKESGGYWHKYTFNEQGSVLTYKDQAGFWYEYTYNKDGKVLKYEDQDCWTKYTYNDNNQIIFHEDSDGFSYTQTYDENGYKLTYKDNYELIFKTGTKND